MSLSAEQSNIISSCDACNQLKNTGLEPIEFIQSVASDVDAKPMTETGVEEPGTRTTEVSKYLYDYKILDGDNKYHTDNTIVEKQGLAGKPIYYKDNVLLKLALNTTNVVTTFKYVKNRFTKADKTYTSYNRLEKHKWKGRGITSDSSYWTRLVKVYLKINSDYQPSLRWEK